MNLLITSLIIFMTSLIITRVEAKTTTEKPMAKPAAIATGSATKSLGEQIHNEAKEFWTQNTAVPLDNAQSVFSAKFIDKIITAIDNRDNSLLSGYDDNSAHACKFRIDGSPLVQDVELIYSIPTSKTPDVMSAMDHYMRFNNAPATKSITNPTFYRYELDGSGEVNSQPSKLVFNNGEEGVPFAIGKKARMKKCVNPPFMSSMCNTQNYFVKKIDENTAVMYIVTHNLEQDAKENNLFSDADLKRNAYQKGNGLVIIRKSGDRIFIFDKTLKQTSDPTIISRSTGIFAGQIKKSTCTEEPWAFDKRLGVTNNYIASDLSGTPTKSAIAKNDGTTN